MTGRPEPRLDPLAVPSEDLQRRARAHGPPPETPVPGASGAGPPARAPKGRDPRDTPLLPPGAR